MKIIGIAGGSGSGKSTVSYGLVDENPEIFEVLNFDDYHKSKTHPDLPMMNGAINWDHPDIVRWDNLINDVEQLKSGRPITIETKARRENPDYPLHHQTVMRTINPKPVLIVEGYLSLYNPDLLKLFDKSFYLNLDHDSRMKLRDKNTLIGVDDYVEKVLKPMHEQYVEPSKQNADVVIEVANMPVQQICAIIRNSIGL